MTARGWRWLLPALCLAGALGFGALGVWQLERRAWKLALIERVDARLAAPAIPLPPPPRWPALARPEAEYLRVTLRGRFLHDAEALVDALTARGAGFWVITPLETRHGIVLVNRGFVPRQRALREARGEPPGPGPVTVTGLVRTSEPGGRILRPNRPAEDRWFSRDVRAIAASRGLGDVAPFFVDAAAPSGPGGYPIAGMTVVRFRNAHLAYALTWFALALGCLAGLVVIARSTRRDAARASAPES